MSFFLTIFYRIVISTLVLNCYRSAELNNTGKEAGFGGCDEGPSQSIHVKSNETVSRFIDYRPGCVRSWILERDVSPTDGGGKRQITIKSGAILVISHLELDYSVGDYLLIADQVPDETNSPKSLVLTGNIITESKTTYIYSPITWIGLFNGAKGKSTLGLVFTWVPPELIETEETLPSELRDASINLCFERIECSLIVDNLALVKTSLALKINDYFSQLNSEGSNTDNEDNFLPIDDEQIKLIRNESRIKDETNSEYKYCWAQLVVTYQPDINWVHPKLNKKMLTVIWFANSSGQVIETIEGDEDLVYQACEDQTFDPWISITSAVIFLAGLGASIGLWRWHHLHILSSKQTIKDKSDERSIESRVKHNPIYESDEEDVGVIVLGGTSRY